MMVIKDNFLFDAHKLDSGTEFKYEYTHIKMMTRAMGTYIGCIRQLGFLGPFKSIINIPRVRNRMLRKGCQKKVFVWSFTIPPSDPRGHENVHDDMNIYVIMHDQCLFIAMINSFHT